MKASNKLIFTYAHGSDAISTDILTSYGDALLLDENKRTLWYRGHQYGNSYYGSVFGESFNDFANNNASGDYSHAEGTGTSATGFASHAENTQTTASGIGSSAQGFMSVASGDHSHSEGTETSATGNASHAEGTETSATGECSHAEGEGTTAYGYGSHTEGAETTATGECSHAEGVDTTSYGDGSHSEGYETVSYGDCSHVEGKASTSYGVYSHAEGEMTTAYGIASHAEGVDTVSYGDYSHAEGYATMSYGNGSHTDGIGTVAYNENEIATGRYNSSVEGQTIFTIGDGTDNEHRHNAIAITNNATYMGQPSYFGNYIYGSITYSYVDILGPDVTLEDALISGLEETKYTRPLMDVTFLADGTPVTSAYSSNEQMIAYTYMMPGTRFSPGMIIDWPDTSVEGGTRMSYAAPLDYSAIPPRFLGYSYGPVTSDALNFRYAWSNGEETVIEPNATYTGSSLEGLTNAYISINDTNDYEVINDISLSYQESSYMVYSRLWQKGIVRMSYGYESPKFDAGTTYIPVRFVVRGRYKWMAGLCNEVPESYNDFLSKINTLHTGWLTETGSAQVNEVEFSITEQDAQSSVLVVLMPFGYQVHDFTGNGKIRLRLDCGIENSLITELHPLSATPIYVQSGIKSLPYEMMYIKMRQSPIGIPGANICMSVSGTDPLPDNEMVLTDYGWPLGAEDGSVIQLR